MSLFISLFILFISVVFHEYAHAWVANKLGDPTAKLAGRLTLNPLKHIDPFGSIILPAVLILSNANFLFAWAKPVPVNFWQLKNPKRDMIFVGIAGPVTNIILAMVASLFLRISISPVLNFFLLTAVLINVVLATFNMLPIPPLDGSRLVFGLLPPRLAYQYARIEPYGILIVLVLVWLGLFQRIILPVVNLIVYFLLKGI